jgi:hypothetical protein
MKYEDINLDYLRTNTRFHTIEVLDRNGIIGKSINGYPRMISRFVDPLNHNKSDYTVMQYRDLHLFAKILEFYNDKKYTTNSGLDKKIWLHFKLKISGVTVVIDTKEYLEYSPKNRVLVTKNIFLFENEISEFKKIIDWELDSLAYLDKTGNNPNYRYYN